MKPLYKKGDKKGPQNYRPIILLSTLSISFEKINLKRMMNFCQTNKLLTPMQHGFRNKMFCTDVIAALTAFIRNVSDEKLTGTGCFIDLQKHFDTLDQKILLIKKLGSRGNIKLLISSSLTDKWQYVVANKLDTKKTKNLPWSTTGVGFRVFSSFFTLITYQMSANQVRW